MGDQANGETMNTIRVTVAHTQPLIADTLVGALRTAGIQVAGVATTGREAVEQISRLAPDVLVTGRFEDVRPADLTAAGKDRTAVLMVNGRSSADDLAAALEAGIGGYLTTSCSATQLIEAVRRVAAGEVVVLGVDGRRSFDGGARAAAPGRLPLTPREMEILRLICEGNSNADIARALYISHHTVRTHVQNIRAKLKVRSKLEAAIALLKPEASTVQLEPATSPRIPLAAGFGFDA